MKRIRAILADDEASSRNVLSSLLERHCPEVELVGKYKDLPEAVQGIRQFKPQLVFLDIEMPNYAGFEIVNFFENIDFKIIFVTAYNKYAITAFEVSAIDYLVKPVDVDRLKNAVKKALDHFRMNDQAHRLNLLSKALESSEIKKIAVVEKGNQHILSIDDIIAIEAQESYCNIYTSGKRYVVSKNLKHFEQLFANHERFCRVHKSWIVNISHILKYSKSDFTITLSGNLTAKLSKYKKAEFELFMLR